MKHVSSRWGGLSTLLLALLASSARAEPVETAPQAPPGANRDVEIDESPATLLDRKRDITFGGFGGPSVLYTRFASEDAVLVCGDGGLIIDHALTLGGGGCGVATRINGEPYGPGPHDADDRLRLGYGGFLARYHFLSKELVNVSVGALIGAGGLSLMGPDSDRTDDHMEMRGQAIFVFVPEVGAHLNVTRWLRLGVTLGYRSVTGVDIENLSNSDVAGPVAGGHLYGGWF